MGVGVTELPEKVLISEVFGPVVQGEGPIIGRRTIFIRTFGCDSRCMGIGGGGCDTLYAVDPVYPGAETRTLMSFEEIVQKVLQLDQGHRLPITISGGNPAMWDLTVLVDYLQGLWHEVWIETQGTIWRDWLKQCDKVVVSPKGPGMNDVRHGVLPINSLQPFVDNVVDLSFKVVVFVEADLDYAEKIHIAFPSTPLYLSVGSPVDQYGYDRAVLNDRLRIVMEQVLQRPALSRAIVLPQLHALAYGGSRGV